MISRIKHIAILAIVTLLVSGCAVHEWPDTPEKFDLCLDLQYSTQMTLWHHSAEGSDITEIGEGPTIDSKLANGYMRYNIKAYPSGVMRNRNMEAVEEFTFIREIADTYNSVEKVALPAGEYDIVVWCDFLESIGDDPFYNANTFTSITTRKEHIGSNNYRDAFRGDVSATIVADILDKAPDTIKVDMHRPLAKIEFVSNDLSLFFKNQNLMPDTDSETSKSTLLEAYSVICNYIGFMPNTYNIITDKHTDSAVGVSFKSDIRVLKSTEASIAFDYVLVNDRQGFITIQLTLLDKDGQPISFSEVMDVPIKRDYHTIVRGKFLTGESSGGIGVDPSYDDEFNIVLP